MSAVDDGYLAEIASRWRKAGPLRSATDRPLSF